MSPTSYHTAPPRTKENELYAQILVASRDINAYKYLHTEGNGVGVKRHVHTTIDLPENVWKVKFKSSLEDIRVYHLREKEIHFVYDNDLKCISFIPSDAQISMKQIFLNPTIIILYYDGTL